MLTIEENIQRFEELLGSVQRPGMDKLINYIKKNTDFYSAPASTRFHLSCEGGLLQHSLNVYDCLVAKKENPIWQSILAEISDENLIVCGAELFRKTGPDSHGTAVQMAV